MKYLTMDFVRGFYDGLHGYVDRVHSVLPNTTGEPILFDLEFVWEEYFSPAVHVALALFLIHFGLIIPACHQLLPRKVEIQEDDGRKQSLSRDRMAFQVTNLGVNLLLTLAGLSFEFDERRQPGTTDVIQRLTGLEDMGKLPAWQIGVQLWALPIGLLQIDEEPLAIAHHICLIWTALVTCLFRNGFRWHAPFFYGVFELSSVPLGFMNIFKSHPSWATDYPVHFRYSRLAFAVAFLLVRIVWCTPRMLLYLADLCTYMVGLPLFSLLQLYCLGNFLSSLLLFFLQFLWASKVVAALSRMFLGKGRKSTKTA